MAKVRPGTTQSEISGSIGGLTYARNRYGSYVRSRSNPVNPNSPGQIAVRAILAAVSRDWSALTDSQRDAWILYADNTPVRDRFGMEVTLTGAAMYNRVNCARLSAGLDTLDAAPTIFGLPAADPSIEATLVAANAELSLTFDNTQDWATAAKGRLLVYGGKPVNPNIGFYGGPFKQFTGVSGGTTAPTSPATLTYPYAVSAGQRVWLQYRILTADGRLSNPFRVGPINCGAGE